MSPHQRLREDDGSVLAIDRHTLVQTSVVAILLLVGSAVAVGSWMADVRETLQRVPSNTQAIHTLEQQLAVQTALRNEQLREMRELADQAVANGRLLERLDERMQALQKANK